MAEKYITLNKDGKDYRAIANMMTKAGYPMNHATARNVLMSGMAAFIKDVSFQVGKPLSEEELSQLSTTKILMMHWLWC